MSRDNPYKKAGNWINNNNNSSSNNNNNNLYLPSAVFIAQVLVGPSIKRDKEMVQIENNMAKNPNWLEADQLAIFKRGRGVELGATGKQLLLAVRAGLEPETSGFQVRRPNPLDH